MKRRGFAALIVAGTVAGSLSASPQPGRTASQDPALRDALQAMGAALRNLSSVHLHAKGFLQAAGGRSGAAESQVTVDYTYWAAGRKYMVAVSTAGSNPLAPDFSVAFNGKQLELFIPAEGLLSVQKDDSASLPISLPNPFLLFFDYLHVINDGCDGCMPRIPDLNAKALRLGNPEIVRLQANDGKDSAGLGTDRAMVIQIPGDADKGTAFEHRLTLEPAGSGWRLRRCRRLTRDGRVLSDLHYDGFTSAGPHGELDFPSRISLDVYDPEHEGALQMHLEYSVDVLEINRSISDEKFSLDWEKARSIWDSDSKTFIKGGKVKG